MATHFRARSLFVFMICALTLLFAGAPARSQQSFTLEQMLGAPFPSSLVTAKSVPRVAWVFDEQGKRNIYVAEAPEFKARRLTAYLEEDGQELSGLQFSADGSAIVYTRGEGKNKTDQSPNPASNPAGVEQAVYQISWIGGDPKKIDAGHSPQVSSKGACAYVKDGALWIMSLSSNEKPAQLMIRGTNGQQLWSPDGSKLAFRSDRGDHSFIGIYEVAAKSVRFVAPTVDSDSTPEWSEDGKQLAFVRRNAVPRDTPEGYFIEPDRPHPWAIWVAEAGAGAWNAKEVWH